MNDETTTSYYPCLSNGSARYIQLVMMLTKVVVIPMLNERANADAIARQNATGYEHLRRAASGRISNISSRKKVHHTSDANLHAI
jgi:hypothetical protein